MKLIPLADRVVLKPMEAEETTKGGIILTSAPAARWTARRSSCP